VIEETAHAATETPAANQRLILFTLWTLVFSASSQLMIVVAMLPVIGEQLNVASGEQGLLVSVYALMVGAFALVIGPVSDKIGRRRVLLAGTGLMTAALALHAAANDYQTLLAVRTLAGVAGGVLSGAAVSYVGDFFPYERRGWANGWVMSGISAGQIAGVPLGSFLAERFGFRTPFLIFAATMGATFLLTFKFVPQPAVALNTGKLSIGNALREYLNLLRQKEIAVAALVFALLFLSVAFYITYFPVWLAQERGASPDKIAWLFFAGGVASVVAGPTAGKLSDLWGRKPLILASSLGLTALMASVTFIVSDWLTAFPVFFITSLLLAARMSPFQALLSALVGGNRRGALMSLTVALGQISFAIGAALAGVVYTTLGFDGNTLIGASIAVAVAAIVYWRLPEPSSAKQT
jgi:predicted MFS family arabinose efflux permease